MCSQIDHYGVDLFQDEIHISCLSIWFMVMCTKLLDYQLKNKYIFHGDKIVYPRELSG